MSRRLPRKEPQESASSAPRQAPDLTAAQVAALPLLLAGQTARKVSAEVGVRPEAISRWRAHNPAWRAAWNRAIRDRHEAITYRLDALTDRAVDVLADALDQGDANVALRLLTRWDARPVPSGPTTVREVAKAMARNLVSCRQIDAMLDRLGDEAEVKAQERLLLTVWCPEATDEIPEWLQEARAAYAAGQGEQCDIDGQPRSEADPNATGEEPEA